MGPQPGEPPGRSSTRCRARGREPSCTAAQLLVLSQLPSRQREELVGRAGCFTRPSDIAGKLRKAFGCTNFFHVYVTDLGLIKDITYPCKPCVLYSLISSQLQQQITTIDVVFIENGYLRGIIQYLFIHQILSLLTTVHVGHLQSPIPPSSLLDWQTKIPIYA